MVQRWRQDREAVTDALRQMEDPLRRLTLVMALTEAWPGETHPLCDLLADPLARERCSTINSRPHLWPQRPATSAHETTGPVATQPGSGGLLPADAASPWAELAPDSEPCTRPAHTATCYAARAHALAARQLPQQAASACLAISQDKWRWDCIFQASEALLAPRRPQDYGPAADLCLLAGDFTNECLAHARMALAEQAPSATGDAAGWARMEQVAVAIHTYWARYDPTFAELVQGRFWADGLAYAYSDTPTVCGDPLDALPPTVAPHVRAAAACRLLEVSRGDELDLTGWTQTLQEALTRRCSGTHQRRGGERWSFPKQLNPWPPRAQARVPAVVIPYLDSLWRPTSGNEEVDATLCILAAAAQYGTWARPLLREGTRHPVPLVQAMSRSLLRRSTHE